MHERVGGIKNGYGWRGYSSLTEFCRRSAILAGKEGENGKNNSKVSHFVLFALCGLFEGDFKLILSRGTPRSDPKSS